MDSTRLPHLLACTRPGRQGRGGIRSPRPARRRYQLSALQGAVGGASGGERRLALRIGRHGLGLSPSWSPPASPPVPVRSSPPPRHETAGIVLPCQPLTECSRRLDYLAGMTQSVALAVRCRACRAIAARAVGDSSRRAVPPRRPPSTWDERAGSAKRRIS